VHPAGAVDTAKSNPVIVSPAGNVQLQYCAAEVVPPTGQLQANCASLRTYAVVATFVLLSPAAGVVAALPLGSVSECANEYPLDVFVVPSGSVTVPVNVGEAIGAAPVTCDTV